MSTSSAINELVDAAAEHDDPLNGLVARCALDPGAAFDDEVIAALANLRSSDRKAFESLRVGLKRAKVRVTALDEAIEALLPTPDLDPDLQPLRVSVQLLQSDYVDTVHWQGEFRQFARGAYRPLEDGAIRHVRDCGRPGFRCRDIGLC